MAKVDMHTHSVHSEHPSEWFLQRIGAAESYTDPIFIYNTARALGMDFVTITDHNRISGSLLIKEKYTDSTFMGVESTVYFPTDGCKVHILVYGLNEEQFEEIQRIRTDIYDFRAYIMQENLAYSVAHATYSVNNRLKLSHLEQLILLFDIFEGVNGGRNRLNNEIWTKCLANLTPEIISDLYSKYKIEPMSKDPWIKGITGGSDDHAGFFIGRTFTEGKASTPEEFLQTLKAKKTIGSGRHNDYKSLAFAIYKIAYDFSKQKSSSISNPILAQFTNSLFEKKTYKSIDKFSLYKFFMRKKIAEDPIKVRVYNLLDQLEKHKENDMDFKFDLIFTGISDIIDELFLDFVKKIMGSVEHGDLFSLLREIGSVLPSLFLSFPFFSTLGHMNLGKPLFAEIEQRFNLPTTHKKKILWFTDTFTDLNGVSFTLQKIAATAIEMNKDIHVVSCIKDEETAKKYQVVNLDCVYTFALPHYESYKMNLPSLLATVENLAALEPTEIYISTPGPIGLLGLLIAKLLRVPTYGIYHTDFTQQYIALDDNTSAKDLIEVYTKWFYESFDHILVPTKAYIDILVNREYNPAKFGLIYKGIEKSVFYLHHSDGLLKREYNITGKVNLLYAGRVSKDKNIDLLVYLVKKYSAEKQPVNLIVAGDGPYLNTLKETVKNDANIYLLGEIKRDKLPELYSACDCFIFPSNTDTFGMVVLEALACGLPCLVTDIGGPQELITQGENGFVCSTEHPEKWIEAMDYVLSMKADEFMEWRKRISQTTHDKYNWHKVVERVWGE